MVTVIAAIIFLLAVILFVPLKVNVSYKKKNMKFDVKFGPFHIKLKGADKGKKQNTEPVKDSEKNDSERKLSFDDCINLLSALYETSKTIKRAVKVEKLELSALYGSGDAAATGFLIGIAYAEIYKLIGFLSCIFTVSLPVITITPCYDDEPVFSLDFDLIIKSNAAKIIYTAIKFYTKYKAYK